MACPTCGCKETYHYCGFDDTDDPGDERLECCAACGLVFDVDEHAGEDDED